MRSILLVLFTIFFAVALGTYVGSQVIEVPGDASYLESATLWKSLIANESGGDNDSRIEGDTDANLIYTDAGNDRVGIGDSTPSYKLDVNGTLQAVTSITTPAFIISDGTAGTIMSLAAVDTSGAWYIIKSDGAAGINDASDFIIYDGAGDYWDGAGTLAATKLKSATLEAASGAVAINSLSNGDITISPEGTGDVALGLDADTTFYLTAAKTGSYLNGTGAWYILTTNPQLFLQDSQGGEDDWLIGADDDDFDLMTKLGDSTWTSLFTGDSDGTNVDFVVTPIGTGTVKLPHMAITDGTARTIMEFAAVDTSGDWIGLDFSGAAGFNDSGDYPLYIGASDYWRGDGRLRASSVYTPDIWSSGNEDLDLHPAGTGDPVIVTDDDSILSLDSGKNTALHGSSDGVIRAAARVIAGADTPVDILVGVWRQGTGTLTNGTTRTKVTYMDDSPSGEWTPSSAELTESDDASYYKVGAKSYKIAVSEDSAVNDEIVSTGPASEDWTGIENIGVWIYSTVALSAGDWDFRLTDGTQGDQDLDVPAVAINTWTWVNIDISGVAAGDKDDVDEVAFVVKVDKGAHSIYFDFLARWDDDDATALTKDIIYDGIRGVDACPIAAASDMAYTAQVEYTDYFISYGAGATDTLVVITDESANCFQMAYVYQ